MLGLKNRMKKQPIDKWLWAPGYCTQCGKELSRGVGTVTYDPYTGNAETPDTVYCPTRIATHSLYVFDGYDDGVPYWRRGLL